MIFQTRVIDETRKRVFNSGKFISHMGALNWAKGFSGKIYFLTAKGNIVMYRNGKKIL